MGYFSWSRTKGGSSTTGWKQKKIPFAFEHHMCPFCWSRLLTIHTKIAPPMSFSFDHSTLAFHSFKCQRVSHANFVRCRTPDGQTNLYPPSEPFLLQQVRLSKSFHKLLTYRSRLSALHMHLPQPIRRSFPVRFPRTIASPFFYFSSLAPSATGP